MSGLNLRVLYLWDFGVTNRTDRDFGRNVLWDIPLLDGYPNIFVANSSPVPGTHHFRGLVNPTVISQLREFAPTAILMFGYNYETHVKVLLSRKLRSIPKILRGDSHLLGAERQNRRFRVKRWLRRWLFSRFSAALAVGMANKQYLLDAGFSNKAIFHSPHCVDNDWFRSQFSTAEILARRWRNEHGLNEQSLLFQFVGKLEENKHPLDLLYAFEKLQSIPNTDLHLRFVGSGDQEKMLRECVISKRIPNVYFEDFCNQSRMPAEYMKADIIVLPSLNETWGLVINEAMNFSKPVIVSDRVGCARDLVGPGWNGWVFRAGDTTELTNKMRDAATMTRSELNTYGANSLERISNYSYSAAADGLEAALRFLREH